MFSLTQAIAPELRYGYLLSPIILQVQRPRIEAESSCQSLALACRFKKSSQKSQAFRVYCGQIFKDCSHVKVRAHETRQALQCEGFTWVSAAPTPAPEANTTRNNPPPPSSPILASSVSTAARRRFALVLLGQGQRSLMLKMRNRVDCTRPPAGTQKVPKHKLLKVILRGGKP